MRWMVGAATGDSIDIEGSQSSKYPASQRKEKAHVPVCEYYINIDINGR